MKRIFCLILFVGLAFLTGNIYAFTLVIDAGHGGHDAGAVGTYSKEKNINLSVALKVGDLIKKNCPDVKVIYTRSTDVFVDLHERASIANRNKADLFISIHTNALPKNARKAVGAETYSLGMARSNENLEVAERENSVILYEDNYQSRYAGFNPKSSESYIIFEFMQDEYMKQSAEFANYIQKQYSSAGRPNLGVKQAGFLVLRETSMPSVLTELGFISTPSEEQYLNTDEGQNTLARSIYNGFILYKNNYSKNKSGEVISNHSDRESTPQANKKQNLDGAGSTGNHTDNVDKNRVNKRDTVIFCVQVMTSPTAIPKNSKLFKGYEKDISFYVDGGLYKYFYGGTQNYSDALATRKDLADVFPGCFVIALKNNQRISVQEANQLLNKGSKK